MERLHGLPKAALEALKSVFIGLAFIAVSLRLVANWKYNRKLLVDDYIAISAIPFLVAVATLSELAGNGFHDPNSSPYRIAQLAVGISVVSPLALWTCKAPILFLYLRVFGVKRWLRAASRAVLALTALIYLAGLVAVPPACAPPARELSEAFIEGCQTRTRMISVFLGGVSVLADVFILVLPMPVIFGLKLLARSRVGLALLFLSGLFAIAASIISLFFKAISLSSPATSLALSILATITECSVALIVGCVPSLRVLWSRVLKPGVGTSKSLSTDPTGDMTNCSPSQYVVVGDGADRRTSSSNKALVVSTEVHTSTVTAADYHQQQEGLQSVYTGQPYFGQTYQRPDRVQFGETVQQPFGVYAEAYALQTKNHGVWGR
ncbi:hypothetical protein F4802DRAFT_8513 [Xylaria palmicola]|nr:hypothetical protein F4802DRAFT_8513 [Xylaria palmicola]